MARRDLQRVRHKTAAPPRRAGAVPGGRRRRRTTKAPGGKAPWALLFWIVWPLAFLLGLGGGALIGSSGSERRERSLQAELREARQEAERLGLLLEIAALQREHRHAPAERDEPEPSRRRPVAPAASVDAGQGAVQRPADAGTDAARASSVPHGSDPSVPDLFDVLLLPRDDVVDDELHLRRFITSRSVMELGPWRGASARRFQSFPARHTWQMEYVVRPVDGALPHSMTIQLRDESGHVVDEYAATRSRDILEILHTGHFYVQVASENCEWNLRAEVPVD